MFYHHTVIVVVVTMRSIMFRCIWYVYSSSTSVVHCVILYLATLYNMYTLSMPAPGDPVLMLSQYILPNLSLSSPLYILHYFLFLPFTITPVSLLYHILSNKP